MNGVGRQGQRSSAARVHHQRQYSDNFLETSSNGRWLQSAGLQHLQSSNFSGAFKASLFHFQPFLKK
ncbi:hypothetical protein CerSpe_287620 [Prunus speciosa]